MAQVGEDARRRPEALSPGDVEGSRNTATNFEVWSYDQHAASGDSKGKEGHQPSLSAADRDLYDGVFRFAGKVIPNANVSFDLGISKVDISLNGYARVAEEACDFLIRHSVPLLLYANSH